MIPFCLEVSGDFACFTRPEMKVERVSMTHHAVGGAGGVREHPVETGDPLACAAHRGAQTGALDKRAAQ